MCLLANWSAESLLFSASGSAVLDSFFFNIKEQLRMKALDYHSLRYEMVWSLCSVQAQFYFTHSLIAAAGRETRIISWNLHKNSPFPAES